LVNIPSPPATAKSNAIAPASPTGALQSLDGLVGVARDIASGGTAGPTLTSLAQQSCTICRGQACPQPINYLANAEPPAKAPKGLAGLLQAGTQITGSLRCLQRLPVGGAVFNGCNFAVLQPLAAAKDANLPPQGLTDRQLRGFDGTGRAGLSVVFGPWSDFCLWCWKNYPSDSKPILILGKDNSPFAEEEVNAGQDWGAAGVMQIHDFWNADCSTNRLFRTIWDAAFSREPLIPDPRTANAAQTAEFHRFIGERRIFVFNVWPWFRCGQNASGPAGIHRDNVFQLPNQPWWNILDQLIHCLAPQKIATLGNWAFDYKIDETQLLEAVLDNAFLIKSGVRVEVFRHPASKEWFTPWEAPADVQSPWEFRRWTGITNRDAFRKFLLCDPTVGRIISAERKDVLDMPVDE
jgi:hypothetical protein